MQKCLEPIDQELGDLPRSTRPVTQMGVELSQNGRMVVLSFDDPNRAADPLVYALSPSAAAQLSRLLKKAVKAYLRAEPEQIG